MLLLQEALEHGFKDLGAMISTKVLLEVKKTPMINLQIHQINQWGLDDFVIITNPQF